MEIVREKLHDGVHEHTGVAQRQTERVSKQMNTRVWLRDRQKGYLSKWTHECGSETDRKGISTNEHTSVAQRQTEKVSKQMNTSTRDLSADLMEHIAQTNNDVAAVRKEMAELGEHIGSKVTDGVETVSGNVIEWGNQIVTEKKRFVKTLNA